MSLLGDELLKLREKKKKSQKAVAAQMGISAQYLSNIEKGKCVMAPDKLKSVSKALRIREKVLVDLAVMDFKNNLISKMKVRRAK